MKDPVSWSITLAQKVAPDEVDLVPGITEAFLKGGEAREELFRRSDCSGTSAFDPVGAAVITPWVLKGIIYAGPYIQAVLSNLGDWTTLVLNISALLALVKTFQAGKSPAPMTPEIPTQIRENLKKTVHAFSAAMESTDWPQEQRDAVAFRAIKALLEDPQNAMAFAGRLQAQK